MKRSPRLDFFGQAHFEHSHFKHPHLRSRAHLFFLYLSYFCTCDREIEEEEKKGGREETKNFESNHVRIKNEIENETWTS